MPHTVFSKEDFNFQCLKFKEQHYVYVVTDINRTPKMVYNDYEEARRHTYAGDFLIHKCKLYDPLPTNSIKSKGKTDKLIELLRENERLTEIGAKPSYKSPPKPPKEEKQYEPL